MNVTSLTRCGRNNFQVDHSSVGLWETSIMQARNLSHKNVLWSHCCEEDTGIIVATYIKGKGFTFFT